MQSWRDYQAAREADRRAQKKATRRVLRDMLREGLDPHAPPGATGHVSDEEFGRRLAKRKRFYLRLWRS